MNTINLAKKQIEDQKITLEQFKKDPTIVYKNNNEEETKITIKKKCKTCKQEKNIIDFEKGRKECKSCRYIKASEQNNNIDEYVDQIKKLKNDLTKLKTLLSHIPKDKLIIIIAKFEVGRKSTDTKDVMVENIVIHFKKLLNPFICRGGCGYTLQKEFSTCEQCKRIKTKTKRSILTFEKEILPSIIERLEPIKLEDDHLYNKNEIKMIAKTLKVKFKSVDKKNVIVEKINKEMKKQKEDIGKDKYDKQLEERKNLDINGIIVSGRIRDGYINATTLCKAGKKKFSHWYENKQSKELIKHLSEELNIPTEYTNPNTNENFRNVGLIVIINKGPNNKRGTWVHPDIAVALACWMSPKFFTMVSRLTRELIATGNATIENKSDEYLAKIEKMNYELMEQDKKYKLLENNHKKILYKRKHHKFKKGPIFYIISDSNNPKTMYKVGIDDTNINRRLAEHRTALPGLKLEYLVYTSKNAFLEQAILLKFESSRNSYKNHEWIFDQSIDVLIEQTKFTLDCYNIDYTIEKEIQKYNEKEKINKTK